MSLNIALLNAISGLQVNSRSLDTTAQNVSNVNTEGYSRKVVQQQAVVVAGLGAGVQIADIARVVNEFMIKEVRAASSQLGTVEAKDAFYQRMQDLFGTLASDSSPASGLADLATKFQALADTPENVSLRTDLTERAKLLMQQFNDIANQIEKLRAEVDKQVEESVDLVNTQLSLVRELNLKIAQNTAMNLGVAELQDQRDIALDKIAKEMDFQQFTRSNGEVVVLTSTGRALVDRAAATLSHTSTATVGPLITLAAGSIDGISLGGTDITGEIREGRIAGLVAMRDTLLPNLHSQLQELATTLHDEINAVHNQGTAYPGLASVTGARTVAAADPPSWTGNLRVTITDASGVVVETQDFDLSTFGTIGNPGGLIPAIDAMANVTASINAAGQVVITPTAGNRVSFNEMDSAVQLGSRTVGASQFLGLNDFFTSTADYDDYLGAYQSSRTTALGMAGTLTFAGNFAGSPAGVAYLAGNDLDDVASAINADANLAAANITATVIADGSGFRLRITDTDGNNFFVADSGNLLDSMAVKPRDTGIMASIQVRSDIANDPSLIARGTSSGAAGLVAGDIAVTTGDKSVIQQLANRFNDNLSFNATNLLAATSTSFTAYAADILSLNSIQARGAADSFEAREVLLANLKANTASISGVNLDEEMSKMIILENAYAASARVITVTEQLFEYLTNMMR